MDTFGSLKDEQVRENNAITSVSMWPVLFPQRTVSEMSLGILQPYIGNSLLMDQKRQSSLRAASNLSLATFASCVPYLCETVDTSHLPSVSLDRTTSGGAPSSVNLEVSRPTNFSGMNTNLNEPTTTDALHQSLAKDGLLCKNDHNNTVLSKVAKDQKNKMKRKKNSPDLTIGVQVNTIAANKDSESLSNETVVENDDFYVSKETELSCLICDMNFWTEELLSTHLEGKCFSCRVCTAEFVNHSELKVHFLGHKSSRCVVCNKAFVCNEDLFNHRKNSLTCTPSFECDICKKKFMTSDLVRKHKHSYHGTGENLISCVVCDKKFQLPFQLSAHQKKCHVPYENMECKVCSLSFVGPEKLKYHTKMSHLKKREICPFTCSTCGKVFYFKQALARHEKAHSEAKEKVVCELCGKSCTGSRALYDHIRSFHEVGSKVKCLICSKEFKYKCTLNVHINNVHKKKAQTPAVCHICGITLKKKEQMKTHLQIHSSERQYKCEICNATFKQEAALRTHGRIHSGICKYTCNNCGKSFKWKQTFDKHGNKCKTTQNN